MFLVRASNALRAYWWIGIGGLAAFGVALKFWMNTPSGRRAIDTLVLRLPQAGRIVRSFTTARIARLLGVLLQGHVGVLESIEMAQGAVRNSHYADLLTKSHDAVLRGETISSAFRESDLISPSVYEAMHHGEQSGQVASLLLNVADFLDEENEVIVKSLTSILEPVILVVMGVLVGLVAMSLFLPLFDLTAMTQGGPQMSRLFGSQHSPIGVSYDGRFIKAAQLIRTGGDWKLAAVARLPRSWPSKPMCAEEVTRLSHALGRLGFRNRRVVVALGEEQFSRGVLELPPRNSGASLNEIARAEMARIGGFEPRAAEMACWDLPAMARQKDATQVMAVACPHDRAEAMMDIFEQGGLEVEALDRHVHALIRACGPRLGGDGLVGVLDLEHDAAMLCLVFHGRIVYERKMPDLGVAALADTLARQLGLDADSVDYVLQDVGLAEHKDDSAMPMDLHTVAAAIRSHLDEVVAELHAPISYATQMCSGATVGTLLLTGLGAGIPGADVHFRSRVDAGVWTVAPADLLPVARRVNGTPGDPALTVAVGLAQFDQ